MKDGGMADIIFKNVRKCSANLKNCGIVHYLAIKEGSHLLRDFLFFNIDIIRNQCRAFFLTRRKCI